MCDLGGKNFGVRFVCATLVCDFGGDFWKGLEIFFWCATLVCDFGGTFGEDLWFWCATLVCDLGGKFLVCDFGVRLWWELLERT